MAKLEDLREWLLDRIDGGEEMRGEDGLVSDFIRQIDAATAELADLKQRLLPQYIGRAERAQRERQMISHERDSLLEKLRAATSMPCAPSATEETAIGHARYEYLRTLNPRKFAALYNEALMGVHQFDDLVDRYRDASQPSPTTSGATEMSSKGILDDSPALKGNAPLREGIALIAKEADK